MLHLFHQSPVQTDPLNDVPLSQLPTTYLTLPARCARLVPCGEEQWQGPSTCGLCGVDDALLPTVRGPWRKCWSAACLCAVHSQPRGKGKGLQKREAAAAMAMMPRRRLFSLVSIRFTLLSICFLQCRSDGNAQRGVQSNIACSELYPCKEFRDTCPSGKLR